MIKNEGIECTVTGSMDFAAKPILEGGERYWMNELQTIFPYDLNSRVGDEFKIDNMRINVAAKFSSILRIRWTWV